MGGPAKTTSTDCAGEPSLGLPSLGDLVAIFVQTPGVSRCQVPCVFVYNQNVNAS